MPKAKITVIKKLNCKELYGENPPAPFDEGRVTPECERFSVGQEFAVDSHSCPLSSVIGPLRTSRETSFMSSMAATIPG